MLESFYIVAGQVGVLFVLMSIGFVCNKTKLLGEAAVKGMTDLVLFVVTPCLLITVFQREFKPALLGGLGLAFAVSLVANLVCIAFAHSVVRDHEKRRQSVLRFALVFSNSGFMAVPLQYALLGADGVFYGAAFIAVFNILLWTYGLSLMGGADGGVPLRKILLNPGMIGCAVGIFFFLTSISLPKIIFEPMDWMAKLNTPVPMVIIGYYLAEANLKRIAADIKAGWVIFLRLLVTPLVVLGLILLAGITNTTMALACMITASAPVAAATTMFAAKFEQDTVLSVEMVAFSTLLSIATMPLVIALAMQFYE